MQSNPSGERGAGDETILVAVTCVSFWDSANSSMLLPSGHCERKGTSSGPSRRSASYISATNSLVVCTSSPSIGLVYSPTNVRMSGTSSAMSSVGSSRPSPLYNKLSYVCHNADSNSIASRSRNCTHLLFFWMSPITTDLMSASS